MMYKINLLLDFGSKIFAVSHVEMDKYIRSLLNYNAGNKNKKSNKVPTHL